MKFYILGLFIGFTACAPVHSNYVCQCPNIISYSILSQKRLATELRSIKPDSEIVHYLLDYQKQRNVLQACHQIR